MKYPMCEVCRKKLAVSFSFFFHDRTQGWAGEWKFCCYCTSQTEDYYVEFESFFSTAKEQADWLAHLREKVWMNWDDWNAMMQRFDSAIKEAA